MITELTDIDLLRIDGVNFPATGIPILVAKSAARAGVPRLAERMVKADAERRFTLMVAYPTGQVDRAVAADGFRDFANANTVETPRGPSCARAPRSGCGIRTAQPGGCVKSPLAGRIVTGRFLHLYPPVLPRGVSACVQEPGGRHVPSAVFSRFGNFRARGRRVRVLPFRSACQAREPDARLGAAVDAPGHELLWADTEDPGQPLDLADSESSLPAAAPAFRGADG
jgi:hypothetical protein